MNHPFSYFLTYNISFLNLSLSLSLPRFTFLSLAFIIYSLLQFCNKLLLKFHSFHFPFPSFVLNSYPHLFNPLFSLQLFYKFTSTFIKFHSSRSRFFFPTPFIPSFSSLIPFLSCHSFSFATLFFFIEMSFLSFLSPSLSFHPYHLFSLSFPLSSFILFFKPYFHSSISLPISLSLVIQCRNSTIHFYSNLTPVFVRQIPL